MVVVDCFYHAIAVTETFYSRLKEMKEGSFIYHSVSQKSAVLIFVETLLLPKIYQNFSRARNLSGVYLK